MSETETFSASVFKAHCLEILDRLAGHQLSRAVVTKRGRPVAILVPHEDDVISVETIQGFMKGSVVMADGLDLTEPVLDEPLDAELGKLTGD